MSTSIIDYVFRELAITYLGRHDLEQVVEDVLRLHSIKKDAQDPECTKSAADPQALASAAINMEVFPSRRGNGNGSTGNGHSTDGIAHKLELTRETVTLTATAVQVARHKGSEGDPCTECKQFKLGRKGPCPRHDTCGASSRRP